MLKRSPLLGRALIVLLLAIIANSVALRFTSPNSAGDGDGPFYISIARSLAAGKGYILQDSFWPNQPTMGRAPVWPALLSITARIAPGLSDHALLRLTAACLNSANALLFFGIGFLLSRNMAIALGCGISYALYPVALALATGGNSEIPYVFVTAIGLILILRGGRLSYAGALILGLGPLVRSNYVALPVMVALIGLYKLSNRKQWKRFAIMTVLFWLPAGIWVVRNYALSGEPILSTIEGETLYGANNEYVANNLAYWGYWVFPNEIPGEIPKNVLAKSMSERGNDLYYHRKGMAFLKSHVKELPRLELGKLIRSFIPVPWVPNTATDVVFLVRGLLYLGILLSLATLYRMDERYRLIVSGQFLVLLVTVLIYYGTYRFTFCVEVFLIPAVSVWFFSWIEGLTGRLKAEQPGEMESAAGVRVNRLG